MRENVSKFMSKATKFYEQNKDYILNQFSHRGDLISLELDSQRLAKDFDLKAGIDYVYINNVFNELYGVAARVNFANVTKGHLTIRFKRKTGTDTEYKKRIKSIHGNSMYPAITMQIDSDNGSPGNGIIVMTKELYLFIEENFNEIQESYLNECREGNQYLSIPYQFIQQNLQDYCKIFDCRKAA